MKNLKVIFMGTPEFSVPVLEYLIENTNVVLVVTQPDKEIGRDKKIVYSPIKKVAIDNNIDVFQPIKIRNEYEIISEINPDIIITCAFGQILPKSILDIPKYGCINIHASLLPKYRGASPMQEAILNGDAKTGITLMYMDEGMDTGDILAKEEIEILPTDNIGTLHDKLSLLGKKLLSEELENIINGNITRIKQDDAKATYTKMIKREDELLDFSLSGKDIINKIRAYNPYPLAYFKLNNLDIKVLEASFIEKNVNEIGKVIFEKKEMFVTCKDGLISLKRVKPFGKKEMDIVSYLNGIKKEENLYVNK